MRAVVVSLLVLSAGCRCDIRGWALDKAGDSAVDCGFGRLGELYDAQYQCTVDAFRDGEPFYAFFELRGIDSQVFSAITSDGERVWRAIYDSDTSGGDGGSPAITEFGCAEAGVEPISAGSGASGTLGQERVVCRTSSYTEDVCN